MVPDWHCLVEQNIRLVTLVAARLKHRLPEVVDAEDLVSAGNVGLCRAAQLFDARRGCTFRTYAAQRIRGAMLDWLRQEDHVPRMVRIKAKREGTEDSLPMILSVDAPTHLRGDLFSTHTWLELLKAPNNCPVQHASNREWPAVFNGLSTKQRQLIELKYRGGLTLLEIGEKLGFSEAHACQLHKSALRVWREWIATKRQYADGGRDDSG